MQTERALINKVKYALISNDIEIKQEAIYRKYGYRIKTSSGTSILFSATGKVWCQGKQKERLMLLIGELLKQRPKKVFIAYGRDTLALTQAKDFLREINIDYIEISEQPNGCEPIMSILRENISECNAGIIICTPDDVGRLATNDLEKSRVRQNVLIELGMLLQEFGFNRVMLIMKKDDNWEIPSDIGGLFRVMYEKNIDEVKREVICNLKQMGYEI